MGSSFFSGKSETIVVLAARHWIDFVSVPEHIHRNQGQTRINAAGPRHRNAIAFLLETESSSS